MRKPLRLEAGVDWITSTSRIGTDQAERIMHYGAELASRHAKQGSYALPQRVLGFDGFTIGKTIFYGQSHSHCMLRVTGEGADSAYKEVNRAGDHYSRLDIQATVWLPKLPDTYRRRLYDILTRQYNPEKETGGVPRQTGDAKGGWTVYSAQRTCKQMARIYSKWHETPEEHYKGAIRYELELKDAYATDMAAMLHIQDIHAERYICSYLKLWFKRKGVVLPYEARTSDISLLSVPHLPTDTEKQLAWLERQVKPTVKKLVALGLHEYVTMLLFGSLEAEKVTIPSHTEEGYDDGR